MPASDYVQWCGVVCCMPPVPPLFDLQAQLDGARVELAELRSKFEQLR